MQHVERPGRRRSSCSGLQLHDMAAVLNNILETGAQVLESTVKAGQNATSEMQSEAHQVGCTRSNCHS